jgi:zinc protease
VRGVIAQAMAAPPTRAEVDREYAELDGVMKADAGTARVEAGAKQADDLAAALDIRETVTTPQASYEVLQGAHAKNMFTPATLLASTRRLFRGTATRALVNLHEADPTAQAKLAAALTGPVRATAAPRAAAASVALALPAFGAPGQVVSRTPVAALDLEQVNFANGVRLILHANASETGRVYVRVRVGGGYGELPADRPSPVWAGDDALMAAGIATPKGILKQDDLDALTAGKTVGLQFSIGDDAFSIAGLTTPADYGEQLALIAAKIEHPGWDPAPVLRAKRSALAALSGQDDSPAAVIGHDLDSLLRDGDPRWQEPDAARIEALTPETFRALWEPMLASGPIEVSVFGDVKPDEAIAAVARTFGALKPRTAVGPGVPARFPAHNAQPLVRTHDGAANQAAAIIAWPTGAGAANGHDARQLEVLAQVFSDRLFDRLRSAAGASYSPQVQSQWPQSDTSGPGRFIAIGQVPPDKTGFFFTLSREIAADLVAKPVGDDELRRLLLPMQQLFLRQATGNLFWLRQLGGAAFDPSRYAATQAIPAELANVTPASLQKVAAKYLLPAKDWTMVVVPKAAR